MLAPNERCLEALTHANRTIKENKQKKKEEKKNLFFFFGVYYNLKVVYR